MPRRGAPEQPVLIRDKNQLYYGDNLVVLKRHFADESVDLIYLDPPFNSGQNYNLLFTTRSGKKAAAQQKAFDDTWDWNTAAIQSYQDTVRLGPQDVSEALQAFYKLVGPSPVLAYLSMMAPRLVELHRVLRPTGSLYLHCDPSASHYLKLLTDAVFGPEHFRNEIIWRRTGSNSALKRFGPLHQTIFYYVKSNSAPFYPHTAPYTNGYVTDYFNQADTRGRYRPVLLTGPGTRKGPSGKPWRAYDPTKSGRHWQPSSYLYSKFTELTGEDLATYPLLERLDKLDEIGLIHWPKKTGSVPNYKWYLDDAPGVFYQDIWAYQPGTEGCVYGRPGEGIDQDVKWLSPNDQEFLPWPTQKPEGILERIIRCSTQEGDVVLDPFCGCGTTIGAAQSLKRRWIGIDIAKVAMDVIQDRLHKDYGDAIDGTYEILPEPASEEDALALAAEDKYEFQWWVLRQLGAAPAPRKKGADRGIDGRIYFFDRIGSQETKEVLVSVKGGKTPILDHVRSLWAVVDREQAAIGLLVMACEPTKKMRAEAAEAGDYYSESMQRMVPRVQIVTVGDLMKGKTFEHPGYWIPPATVREDVPATLIPPRAMVREPVEPERELIEPQMVEPKKREPVE